MTITKNINGITCKFREEIKMVFPANPSQSEKAYWNVGTGKYKLTDCSDWSKIWELATDGYLKTKNRGPRTYGHTDFYLV